MLPDVDGGKDCGTHRAGIRFVAARKLESSAVVGGSTHDGKTGGIVHAILESDGLERGEALVVIHRKRGIELLVVTHSEISVRRERPEGHYTFLGGPAYGGDYNLLLFGAQQPAVAAVRIEAEHAYPGVAYAEILLQRLLHQAELAHYLILGDGGGDILERNVPRNDADFQALAYHKHGHVLHAEGLLEELGMAGETEALGHYGFLVDGARHQHVDGAGLEVAHRPFERGDCSFGGIGGGSARFGEHVVGQASHNVDPLLVSFRCRRNGIGVHLLDFGDGFAVEAEYFARPVNHGGEHI